MENERPTRLIIALLGLALVAVAAGAAAEAPKANWDLPFLATLLAFAALSDVMAVKTESGLKVSANFIALMPAVAFLGATPAALVAVASILIGWLRWREPFTDLLVNVLTFMTFPLAVGIGFQALLSGAQVTAADPDFYVFVFVAFGSGLLIDFAMIGGYTSYVERNPFMPKVRSVMVPLLPSELAAALMAVGVAFIYHEIGLAAVALFGIVLVTFQYLIGALLESQRRAKQLEVRTNQLELRTRQLEVRTKQLASFHVGMLSALLRTLDLRDQMTARHSAAVARYSQAIAKRAGLPRDQEELVHMAGLLHDIGKFILPDRILKADVPLTEEDWMLIRRHPHQGARVVGSVDGYGPVAEIILAHHERIDGTGYPRGLKGGQIPELARIISVADTYDVMTSRDSYRTPVSAAEAIGELRRVAGTQLEPRFVAIFAQLLEDGDIDIYPDEAPDFEKELALEARIIETAVPAARAGRFRVPGLRIG